MPILEHYYSAVSYLVLW